MAQKDVDDLYEQIKATGQSGGVIIQGSVTRTLRGTARVLPVSATAMELANPTGGTDNLPMTGRDARKLRSPKEFVDAARRFLDPDDVGHLFADTLTKAFSESDTQMLRLLLPYLYGVPPKDETLGASTDAMETLLHILTESKPKAQTRPRQTKVVDGVLMEDSPDPDSDSDETFIFDPQSAEKELYDVEYTEESDPEEE